MARIVQYLAIALVPAQTAGPQNAGQAGAWQPHNPVVFAQPFAAAEQQFFSTGALRRIDTVFPDGFRHEEWSVAFKKPLPPERHQFNALVEKRPPRQVDVQGFFGAEYSYQFRKPYPAALQQYVAFQPQGFIVSAVPPQGYHGYQWNYRFAKPVPAATQQYVSHAPRILSTLGATAFLVQDPVVFKKPFPVTEQPFTTAPEPEPFPPPNGWWGYQLEARFAVPFPAALQQFTGYQPQGEIPEFKPPGAGKRYKPPTDYLPQPAWDAKPAKKFRPVWDKGPQGELEQHPQPDAAPQPKPGLPPAALFARPQAPRALPPVPAAATLSDPLALGARLTEARDLTDLNDILNVFASLGLINKE